jgi:hypothetical protein
VLPPFPPSTSQRFIHNNKSLSYILTHPLFWIASLHFQLTASSRSILAYRKNSHCLGLIYRTGVTSPVFCLPPHPHTPTAPQLIAPKN